jgi:hypothetical protein
MTADDYRMRFGFDPQLGDLDRVNCCKGGLVGHFGCGVCPHLALPRVFCRACLSGEPDAQEWDHVRLRPGINL